MPPACHRYRCRSSRRLRPESAECSWTVSISAWVIPSRLCLCSAAWTRNDGEMIGLEGASNPSPSGPPTPGSAAIALTSALICEMPPGVSAFPRKISVTMLTSPDSPNSSSISFSRSGNGMPRRKESDIRSFRRRRAKGSSRSQQNGDCYQDDDRDIRTRRNEPAKIFENSDSSCATLNSR